MKRDPLHVAEKTNWVLHLILLGMLIISIRIWHLAIIQHNKREEEAKRPQHRVMIEPTKRATIRDRYNLPLAINKIEYQATILYENLTAIPRIAWELDETGKKVKRFKRRTYIRELSEYLAKELNLGADRIEDLIHSKAAIYGNRPYVIKENIDEQTFFRLKGHEREWPGLLARPYPKREYPQGKAAGEILGYLGAISKEEYEAILSERNTLKELLAEEYSEEGHQRLLDLDEMAYSMHDTVGKAGIEKQYERQLRGFQGKTHYLADAKGNMLEPLPGSREPVAGQRLLLTLSSELQEYAEQLLMENERVRQTRISGMSVEEQTRLKLKDPWIKGGAIVAMDPHTGEVLALASYPRMDPNDFIEKNSNNVQQWYETDTYVGQIWERQQPLYREKTGDIELDWLTWNKFLRMILPENHEILYQLQQHPTLNDAVTVQNSFAQLCQEHPLISPYQLVQNLPSTHPLWNHLHTIPYDREKLLLIDLYRILIDHERFSDTVLDVFGNQTLSEYHHIGGQLWKHQRELKHIVRQHFRETTFATWRQEEGKAFLKQKRDEEKAEKKWQRPYLDYMDKEEERQFALFWEQLRWPLLYTYLTGQIPKDHPEQHYFETCQAHYQEQPISSLLSSVDPMIAVRYLRTFRPFDELTRPLYSTSSLYRNHPGQIPLEKHLAMAFYPKYGFGFGRSFAYRQATIIGSIFKVATAYQALMQNHRKNPRASYRDLNPLEITDKTFKVKNQIHVAQTKEGKSIPQLYKGGRIPRSAVSQIGKIDCIRALEKSSNPYFSLLAGDFLNDPEDLNRAAETFSFGTKTGIDLPGELPGKLPTDLATNKTGLYAMAIGQHSLVVTPLQTAVMLSILANQGKVPTPKMGALKVGTLPFRYPLDQPPLTLFPTQFKREVELPTPVRNILFAGMQRIVHQTTGDSLWSIARLFPDDRQKITDFVALKNQLIGKTATSEVYERLDLDPNRSGHLYKHTGFGGILFDRDISFHDIENNLNKPLSANPELVIVVYLRYGSFGKEAAPLAAQIAKKYRAIKTKMKHHQALFL